MRRFEPRGAYLWLRHPVYLSFLGLIWFVPADDRRSCRAGRDWTVYIFCGSWLKDQRLIHYLGDRYLRYQAEVPGYPGVFFGSTRSCSDDFPSWECIADPVAGQAPIHRSQSRLRDDNGFHSNTSISSLAALCRMLAAGDLVGANAALKANKNSPFEWVPGTFQPRQEYEDFRRAFGSGEVLIISWPGCTVDSPDLELLTNSLRRVDLFHNPAGEPYIEQVVTGQEVLRGLMADPLNLKREDALARIQGTLIGPDQQHDLCRGHTHTDWDCPPC